ncbi:MAG: hemolysin family protein [Actinomycetota bacterium]
MTTTEWLILAGIAVLFAVSIVTAMGETAFTKMSRVRAMTLEEEGRKGASRLARLLEAPEWTLNIVLLLMMVSHFAVASLVAIIVEDHFGGFGVAVGTVVEVILFFVLAEVAPKTWAILHTDSAATKLSGFLWVVSRFPPLRAITRVLIGLANIVLPGKGLKKGPYTSEEEIRTLADVAAQEEVIEREERRLIHSIFEFGDTVVREVMSPRPDMVVVDIADTIDTAVEQATQAGFSRLPVVRESPDDVAGLVYLKDMIRAIREGRPEDPVTSVVRPAVFVPEQKRVAELLREMQLNRFHMAIVIDEYGGTAGLVTLEDLLEEIVGEIVDEYDVEEPRVEQLDGGGLRVAGRTSIDEVNEVLGAELPATEWDTVGGLMFNLLGHVPVEGEAVACQGIEFKAERIQGRRILTVRIEPGEPETADIST